VVVSPIIGTVISWSTWSVVLLVVASHVYPHGVERVDKMFCLRSIELSLRVVAVVASSCDG
jgi:hypothetical protein